MSVSAEMYIVISLMFAVFAAVAAIGTSVVLGVGFERLRAGFEIVKKQTGFFADAIHKLDERTNMLDEQNGVMKEAVASVTGRVEKVEKQTGFFFESLNSLEAQILQGSPVQKYEQSHVQEPAIVEQPVSEPLEKKKTNKMVLPQVVEWNATSETSRLLQANQDMQEEVPALQEAVSSSGVTSSLVSYFLSDNGSDHSKGVVYH